MRSPRRLPRLARARPAWTCAVAAALIEMAAAIELRTKGTAAHTGAATGRRDRAHQLRQHALALTEADVAAYQAVLSARREPHEHDWARRFRGALSAVADPTVAIAETTAELALLAATAQRRTSHSRRPTRQQRHTAPPRAAGTLRIPQAKP